MAESIPPLQRKLQDKLEELFDKRDRFLYPSPQRTALNQEIQICQNEYKTKYGDSYSRKIKHNI